MKKLIVIAALLTLLLSGCSLPTISKTANGKTGSSEQNLRSITMEDMTFRFPKNAKETDIPDQGLPVRGFLLSDDRSNFNLVVETLPRSMDLNEYIKLSSAAAEQTGIIYAVKENRTINNLEWNEAIGITSTGLKLNQRTTLHNGKAYIFTYTAIPANYDKHFRTYESIVKSAQFSDR